MESYHFHPWWLGSNWQPLALQHSEVQGKIIHLICFYPVVHKIAFENTVTLSSFKAFGVAHTWLEKLEIKENTYKKKPWNSECEMFCQCYSLFCLPISRYRYHWSPFLGNEIANFSTVEALWISSTATVKLKK